MEMRMIGRSRRWPLLLSLAVIAGGLLLRGGWKAWEVRRDRLAMEEVEEEIENGRHATAARKLHAILDRQPDSDEALYLLGTCEVARGRTQPAAEAWARVAPDSRFAPRAIFGRMQLQMERGRFSEAERVIRDALEDPRVDASSLPILLGPIYCHQGRLADTLRLIETRWNALNRAGEGHSELAINLVRAHIDLRQGSVPIEVTRSVLEQAGSLAPDDDRIWLGKANLAIRTGAYDEAKGWLDRCLDRRPDDVPVWHGRLDWAVATGRIAEAQDATRHLPVEESTPAEVPRLAAWLATRRGDRVAERRALERLIAVDPADLPALDRLAELAVLQGQSSLAAELRSRKSRIDRLKARYLILYRRNQPRRDAVEMASLARQLGQGFESEAFLTVAIALHPDRDDLRRDLDELIRRDRTLAGAGGNLADILAAEPDSMTGA